ncbi:hypothetical protein GQ44DRAFT_406971 [Phaeosphaeriaceae sp. PMI808]|nr:hypothetical protein GQ44DRAFT_406971 [Phaeosphaeriaceae sp. PMI808]
MDSYRFPPPNSSWDIEIDGLPAILKTPLPTPQTYEKMSLGILTSAKAAKILFGAELYPMYKDWQQTIGNPDTAHKYDSVEEWRVIRDASFEVAVGDLPTPYMFLVFMDISKHEIYFSPPTEVKPTKSYPVLTSICGHFIHPGNPNREAEVCPVCIMKVCIASLERIAQVWSLASESCKRFKNNILVYSDAIKIRDDIGLLWHIEKADWSNLVAVFDDFAAQEQKFEEVAAHGSREKFPESLRVVEKAKSCTQALMIAGKSPHLAPEWSEEILRRRQVMKDTRRAWRMKQMMDTEPLPWFFPSDFVSQSNLSLPDKEQTGKWRQIQDEQWSTEGTSSVSSFGNLTPFLPYWLIERPKPSPLPMAQRKKVRFSKVAFLIP